MRSLIFGCLSVAFLLSPADLARGGGTEGPVMEIVSFRLLPGTDLGAFLDAARATEDLLARQPGFVRRHLLQETSGRWTDLVEWHSLADAHRAAELVMQSPDFGPFVAAINPPTIEMRHVPVIWQMD
ncbi:MAG: antibiotic biosynthesis monooxygenase family protein [Paracoccaceae bacterium]